MNLNINKFGIFNFLNERESRDKLDHMLYIYNHDLLENDEFNYLSINYSNKEKTKLLKTPCLVVFSFNLSL